MSRGRPLTTGRFESRQALYDEIRWLWFMDLPQQEIANKCGVSLKTSNQILKQMFPEPLLPSIKDFKL